MAFDILEKQILLL
jgi:hypothetical protein